MAKKSTRRKRPPPKHPGNRALRLIRGNRTLREAADLAGTHPVYWCALERGHEKLGHRAALKIAEAFRNSMQDKRISFEDLLNGREPAA